MLVYPQSQPHQCALYSFPLLGGRQAQVVIREMCADKAEMEDRYLRMQTTLEAVTAQNQQLQLSNQSMHSTYRDTAASRSPSIEADEKTAQMTSKSFAYVYSYHYHIIHLTLFSLVSRSRSSGEG